MFRRGLWHCDLLTGHIFTVSGKGISTENQTYSTNYKRRKNSKFLNIKYWSIFKKNSSLTDEKWCYIISNFKPKQIFSYCLRFSSNRLRKTYWLIRWFSNLNRKKFLVKKIFKWLHSTIFLLIIPKLRDGDKGFFLCQ